MDLFCDPIEERSNVNIFNGMKSSASSTPRYPQSKLNFGFSDHYGRYLLYKYNFKVTNFLNIFKKLKAKKTRPPKKLKAIFHPKTQCIGNF